jgi:hypothetical protein
MAALLFRLVKRIEAATHILFCCPEVIRSLRCFSNRAPVVVFLRLARCMA